MSASLSAVALLWMQRTLSSLLVACPLVFAIAGAALVGGPGRDALFFQRGALALLELARTDAAALSAALKTCLVLYAIVAVLALVPHAAVLDLLESDASAGVSARFARGVRLFPRFLALSAITLLAQAALLLGSSLFGAALGAGLHAQDERLGTLVPLGVYLVGLLGCAWLGALLDVARGAVVQHELGARAALVHALTSLRREPLAVLSGSYPSCAGGVLAWLCAAWLVAKIDLASPATFGIVLVFTVHQLAILFGVAFRVRWLNAALALSAEAPSHRP